MALHVQILVACVLAIMLLPNPSDGKCGLLSSIFKQIRTELSEVTMVTKAEQNSFVQ